MPTTLKSKANEKKRVRFFQESEASINAQEESTAVSPRRKPKISTMKKLWDAFCRTEDYAGLSQHLVKWKEQNRSAEEFFAREGRLILSLSLLQTNTLELEFICENIPDDLICSILSDNPYILKSFFLGQIGLENFFVISSDILHTKMKRFELLLKIGAKDLLVAALLSITQPIPQGVLDSFIMAIEKWQKEKTNISEDAVLVKRPKVKEVEDNEQRHKFNLFEKKDAVTESVNENELQASLQLNP